MQTEADEAQPPHEWSGDDAADEETDEAAERGHQVQTVGGGEGSAGVGCYHEADYAHFISIIVYKNTYSVLDSPVKSDRQKNCLDPGPQPY